MKFSMTILAALAASTSISASPVKRVYTLADAFLSEDMQEPDTISLSEAETIEFPVEDRPCTHGDDCHSSSSSSSGSIFSPIDALISKIGIAADHPSQAEEIFAQSQVNMINHDQVEDVGSVFEEWKSHLEEMFREAAFQDDVVVSVEEEETPEVEVEEDELNDVKWWRVAEGGKWEVKSGNGKWREARNGEKPPMGKPIPKSTRLQAEEAEEEGALERHHHHGHNHHHSQAQADAHAHHHHHNVASTLTGRLQKVIRNLQPIEAIAFALVLGAGFGSIAHAIFMFALITLRRVRGTDNGSRRIRLQEEESLPAYSPSKGEKA